MDPAAFEKAGETFNLGKRSCGYFTIIQTPGAGAASLPRGPRGREAPLWGLGQGLKTFGSRTTGVDFGVKVLYNDWEEKMTGETLFFKGGNNDAGIEYGSN